MGGHVSSQFDDIKDEDIPEVMWGYTGDKQPAMQKMIEQFHGARNKAKAYKEAYGNGVSVMGIVSNLASGTKMSMTAAKTHSGKEWNQSLVHLPSREIQPCTSSAFFHAKRDGAAYGCCAGFTYTLYNATQQPNKKFITMVWWIPHGTGKLSGFRIVKGSALDYELKTVFNEGGNGELYVDPDIQDSVRVNCVADAESSTAAVCFSVKTDEIVMGPEL